MKASNGKRFQKIRIFVQIFFTVLFFFLLILAGRSGAETFTHTDFFFYLDPLLLLVNFIATWKVIPLFLISLIPVVLTILFGRFFCGWVCPFGAINQFFSWLFQKWWLPKSRKAEAKQSAENKKGVNRSLLKLKYFILAVLLVSALFGTHFTGWLDPFSLLTRTATTVITPSANYLLEHSLKKGAEDKDIVSKGLKPFYNFTKKNFLTGKQRIYTQTIIIGGIFFLIILLNLYKRRFFCNYLCPLGALFGIISKFSLHRFKPGDSCISCNVCSHNCTYNGSPYKDYMKSECMLCFNCVADCPKDCIDIGVKGKNQALVPIDYGRRMMLGSIATGLVLGALPKIAIAAKKKIHGFLRPPGSVSEKQFIEKCIRCGECMQVCPTNFIQPALLEAGVEGTWTPVLNAQSGYCEYNCNKCTQVCPTKAITPLTIKEKKEFKIGTAVIDRNRCYTYADGYNCAVCEEHCPVPDKAIKFREVDVWNFEGQLVKVKQIYVEPDLCIGCGICEHVCPRSDAPGILMSSEEEQREALMGF